MNAGKMEESSGGSQLEAMYEEMQAEVQAEMGNMMYRMRKEGYTLEEISNAFDCYPSTVKRRIEKARNRKEA